MEGTPKGFEHIKAGRLRSEQIEVCRQLRCPKLVPTAFTDEPICFVKSEIFCRGYRPKGDLLSSYELVGESQFKDSILRITVMDYKEGIPQECPEGFDRVISLNT